MTKLKVLDLFSGIGGFSLGLERTGGFETVAFCEIEPFPRRVLAKHWPGVFIHDDVRTLNKDTLCKGYAENALLNHLCKEMGGSLASVKNAITSIKKHEEQKTRHVTMLGPLSAEKALSTIMAGNVPVAENASTHFWQSITNIITEILRGQATRELCGSSLSSEDFLTIIKFSVTIAIQQKQFTVPAHIRELLKVPCYEDVRTLSADRLARDGIAVDVICGGFPCQDISLAGNGAGLAGKRSGLFFEIARLVGELRPSLVVLENVAALLGRGIGDVLGTLAALGYDAEWHCIPASYAGARQLRDRVWIVAYPQCDGVQGRPKFTAAWCEKPRAEQLAGLVQPCSWPTVSGARDRGTGHGVPHGTHRNRAIGNAVVPQVVEMIGRAILASRATA